MKQLFSLLFALLLPLAASAVTVRLDVDDQARVAVDVNDVAVTTITEGINTLDVAPGSYVTVRATPGNMLLSVTETNGDYTYDMPIHAEDGTQFAIISVYSDYGDTYVIRSAPSGDVRTATLALTVDRASALRAVLPSTDRLLELHDGLNEITFNPEQETTIKLTPTGKDFYQVLMNSQLQPSAYSYTLPIADGDAIEVVATYPDIDYSVTFTLEGDGASDFLTAVDVEGRPVFNYLQPGFTVKAGSELKMTGNMRDYEVMAFTINGVNATFANPTTILVTDHVNIYLSVRQYASFPVTVNVDHADRMVLYDGYRYNNDVVALHDGDNTVSVTRNNPRLQLMAAEGYYIESVSLTGEELTLEELQRSIVDLYPLYDNDVIEIRTGVIDRNQTAALYLNGMEQAEGYLSFTRADTSEPVVDLSDGYHVFSFYERDNPFHLGTGAPVPAYVYLNDREIDPRFPESPDYDVNFGDRDVLKVYFGERPKEYTVHVETLIRTRYYEQYLEITKDMIQPLEFDLDLYMDNVPEGSVFLLHRINIEDLDWFISDEEYYGSGELIMFDEDNNYRFTVSHDIYIWNQPFGTVSEMGADGDGVSACYAPDGTRRAAPVRGINILRKPDGSTCKIMVK